MVVVRQTRRVNREETKMSNVLEFNYPWVNQICFFNNQFAFITKSMCSEAGAVRIR